MPFVLTRTTSRIVWPGSNVIADPLGIAGSIGCCGLAPQISTQDGRIGVGDGVRRVAGPRAEKGRRMSTRRDDAICAPHAARRSVYAMFPRPSRTLRPAVVVGRACSLNHVSRPTKRLSSRSPVIHNASAQIETKPAWRRAASPPAALATRAPGVGRRASGAAVRLGAQDQAHQLAGLVQHLVRRLAVHGRPTGAACQNGAGARRRHVDPVRFESIISGAVHKNDRRETP